MLLLKLVIIIIIQNQINKLFFYYYFHFIILSLLIFSISVAIVEFNNKIINFITLNVYFIKKKKLYFRLHKENIERYREKII